MEVVNGSVYNIPPMLPCPFCARTNMEVIRWTKRKYSIVCKCGAESPSDSISISAIVRKWNRRRYIPKPIEGDGFAYIDHTGKLIR